LDIPPFRAPTGGGRLPMEMSAVELAAALRPLSLALLADV
jgi:hypothetical protein